MKTIFFFRKSPESKPDLVFSLVLFCINIDNMWLQHVVNSQITLYIWKVMKKTFNKTWD